MWQRFTLNDVRTIGHYLGVLILFLAAAMAVPFVVALAFQEWKPAANYLLSIGISLILGSALRLLRVAPARLSRRQALAVTGFAWIVLAFMAAIPLYMSGHFNRFVDALFEGVSGLTTTGASLVVDLDHLSLADNVWRFMMILLGGLGLIVVALAAMLCTPPRAEATTSSPTWCRPRSSSPSSPCCSFLRRPASSRWS